jgi:hypothetical protein
MLEIQEVLQEVKAINSTWKAVNKLPKTKKYMVIDYEGASDKRPYNLGIVIGDKNRIYYKSSILMPEFLEENLTNTNLTAYSMAMDIIKLAEDPQYKNEFTRVTANDCIKLLYALVNRYDIKGIWAYNVAFDRGATKRLMGGENSVLWQVFDNQIEWYDIQREIFYTKLYNQKYIKWCLKNQYLTPSGNIQTKEEVVYRYLFKNTDYTEKHIGVYDALDEYQILLVALSQKKKRVNERKGKPLYMILNELRAELTI